MPFFSLNCFVLENSLYFITKCIAVNTVKVSLTIIFNEPMNKSLKNKEKEKKQGKCQSGLLLPTNLNI